MRSLLKNYFKITIRNLVKNKITTFINVIGLSVGLTIIMLIFLNVQFQFNFDNFNKKSDRIYLVKLGDYYATPPAFADYISNNIPEVKNSVRFDDWKGRKTLITYHGKSIIVRNIIYTDPSVFDIFSLKVISGDAETSLMNPYSLVLSENEAKKLFGFQNPLGRVVRFNNEDGYTITAVVEDPPANATHVYGGFVPFNNRSKLANDWNGNYFQTYFLFSAKQKASVIGNKIKTLFNSFLVQHGIKNAVEKYPLKFLPLKDVYFNNEAPENYRHGSKQTVYIFLIIGLLILCLAVLNYFNLSLANATTRLKEIAIRKTIGSNKSQLITQFFFESIIMSLLAGSLAVVFLELSLPFVNRFTSLNVTFNMFNSHWLFIAVLAGTILIGIIIGVFPSFSLSSLNTINSLKGNILNTGAGVNFKRILIVFQFSVSIILLFSTIVIMKQKHFIQTKNLGFNKKQIICFDLNNEIKNNKELFRNMLIKNPDILDVSYTRFNEADANNFWEDKYEGQDIKIHPFWTDANYIKLMGIKIIKGRDFSDAFATDRNEAIILNQTAVKQFGIKSPIGKKVFGRTIVGIVKDFNYQSLHHRIEPLGLIYMSDVDKANIRISANNIPATLNFIKKTWRGLSPSYPFEYHFLKDSYDQLYKSEEKTGALFDFFSLIALFIACLGLFGIVSFSGQQRIKEIGIRKVLGASVTAILYMFSKDFVKLVIFANLVAWPIAWYAMDKWLQDFAYRTNISWWMFIFSGGIALVIALVTMSFQAIKAARANPVDSLRYE